MAAQPRPRALITGITGQDGSYLAELLIGKGYEVHGLTRRASSINTRRLDHLYQDPHEPDRRLVLHYGDMCDATSLGRLLDEIRPGEVYNLAAQSHVKVSFETPEQTGDIVALGAIRLLDAIRRTDPAKRRERGELLLERQLELCQLVDDRDVLADEADVHHGPQCVLHIVGVLRGVGFVRPRRHHVPALSCIPFRARMLR